MVCLLVLFAKNLTPVVIRHRVLFAWFFQHGIEPSFWKLGSIPLQFYKGSVQENALVHFLVFSVRTFIFGFKLKSVKKRRVLKQASTTPKKYM